MKVYGFWVGPVIERWCDVLRAQAGAGRGMKCNEE
jgi:hypothetical protein